MEISALTLAAIWISKESNNGHVLPTQNVTSTKDTRHKAAMTMTTLCFQPHIVILVPAAGSSASPSLHRAFPASPSASSPVSSQCVSGTEGESRCFSVNSLTSALKRRGCHRALSTVSVSIPSSEDSLQPPVPRPSSASLPYLVIESDGGKGPPERSYFQNEFTLIRNNNF